MQRPVRLAIAGLGGFARAHHEACMRLEAEHQALLVATCDPRPQQAEDGLRLQERRVAVFDDFRRMLEHCRGHLDLIALPTPIHTHASMHTAALDEGLAVYLEKPPTLDYAEFKSMLEREASARYPTLVGYNFLLEPERQLLKQRLLSGEFGPIERASFLGWWPRSEQHFQRTPWAGRLQLDDHLVMDSCFGNAMAHFVHNMLFWLGSGPGAFANITRVRAALYRALPIQSADTFFVQARTAQHVELRIAATHACSEGNHHLERVQCERATLVYQVGVRAAVEWHDGRIEEQPLLWPDSVANNYRQYIAHLCDGGVGPPTRLIDAEPFVALNALAFISSQTITTFRPDTVQRVRAHDQDFVQVAGLDVLMDAFVREGRWPSRQWGPRTTPTHVTREALSRLDYVVAAMLSGDG